MTLRTIGTGSTRARLGRLRYVAPGLLCLVLAGLPAPAAAQNLLANPGLTSNLDDWDVGTHTSFEGVLGVPPGSARWQATVDGDTEIEDLIILKQCIEGIVAGTTYNFGGRFGLGARPSGGSANVVIAWQTSPGCSDFVELSAASPVVLLDEWLLSEGSAVAPSGAVSAEFNVVSGIGPFGPAQSIDEADFSLVEGEYNVMADELFFIAQEQVPTMTALWMAVLAAALLLVASRRFRPLGRASA